MEKSFDLQLINETIEELKNNPEACTIIGGDSVDGIFASESVPSEKLSAFIKYLYENELADKKYMENIKSIENKKLEDLTMPEVITMLTFITRGERFTSALLKAKVDDGTFLKLVEMLKKYTEK